MASCTPRSGTVWLSLLLVLLLFILPGQHDGRKQTSGTTRTPATTTNCCRDPGTVLEKFLVIASPSGGNGSFSGLVEKQGTTLHCQSCLTITDFFPEKNATVCVEVNSTLLPDCNISTCEEPSPVMNPEVESRTNSTAVLLWQTPTDCCPTTSPMDLSHSWRNGTAYISGLVPGQDYTMTVYRMLAEKCSKGKSINMTTLPSPVLNITIRNRTVEMLLIGWVPPAEDPHERTYSYQICWWMAPAEDPQEVTYSYQICWLNFTMVYQSWTATVDNLRAGVLYRIAVYAFTKNNVFSVGTAIYARTVPNNPRNISRTNYSNSSVSVSWDPPEDDDVYSYSYNISWFLANKEPLGNNSVNGSNYTIDGLQPGSLYLVKVASVIQDVKSTEDTGWVMTAPLSPMNFRLQNINQTVAKLAWEAPNSSFSGYKLQWKSSTESTENEVGLGNDSTEAVLSWLTPSTNYTFTLLSLVNGTGSVTLSGSIQLLGATKPEQISDMQCSAVPGGYDLKLSWTCPSHNVSKIQILVSRQIWDPWLHQCQNSVVIQHLEPARSYWIQVATFWYEQSALSESKECFTDKTGVIMGPVVALLLVLAIMGLLLFYFRSRRRKPNSASEKEKPEVEAPGSRALASVSVSAFPRHCNERFSSSAFGFAKEYQQLQDVGIEQPQTVAERLENQAKNRYSNVLPYDHSRVQLTLKPEDPNSDYINASYIPGYQGEKEFIAAQGPLQGTLHDFWRMIWEQRITTVVMLTNCVENGREKCERYWPLDYTPCSYEDMTVSVVNETILPDWTVRDFSIKRLNKSEVRLARHYHYTSWPDHGVPPATSAVLCFRDLVRERIEQQEESGPALIHCSAGVGRTGTFIALDSLLRQAQEEEEISVFSFVQRLRMNRPLMIQTESQYIFLHQCLLDGTEAARRPGDGKVEYTAVYENTLALQEYEVSRV